MYIDQVLKKISQYRTDIESSISSMDVTFGENLFANKILDTKESFSNVIMLLSKSLCKGEFVNEKDYKDSLSKSKKVLESFHDLGADSDPKFQSYIISYSSAILFCLNRLSSFINVFESLYTHNRRDHIINDSFKYDKYSNTIIEELTKNVDFFILLIDLSLEELSLKSNIEQVQRLNEIEYKLEEADISDKYFRSLIILKVRFLVNKCCKRLELIYPDFETQGILAQVDDFTEYPSLHNWNRKVQFHYSTEIDSKKFRREYDYIGYNDLKESSLQNLNYFQLHTLIKYYKDLNKSKESLSKIKDYLCKKEIEQLGDYDKYCISVIKNYAINNYFSLISEDKIDNIQEYRKEYLKCIELSSDLTNNYWLEFKYINKVIETINSKFGSMSHEGLSKLYDEYADLINKECDELLRKYYYSKEWSKKNYNYIIILPYQESLVDFTTDKGQQENLLFYSSFILPVDNHRIEVEYEDTKQRYREVKSLLNVIKNLRADLNKLDTLNKDFDKKDQKSIEIIGLFTAIVTFVLSTVPAFRFTNSFNDALLFMLALSISLSFFLACIYVMTDTRRLRGWTVPLIVCMLLLACSLWVALIKYEVIAHGESTKTEQTIPHTTIP